MREPRAECGRGPGYSQAIVPSALDLPGPSRRIRVEPVRLPEPARAPSEPDRPAAPSKDPEPRRPEPAPEREPVPA